MQPSQSPKPVAPIRSADTYSPRHSAVTTETKGVISRCQVGPSQAVIVVPDRVDTATEMTTALAGGQAVRLESDPVAGEEDRYGRQLAHVWLPDGSLLSRRLLAVGAAREYTYQGQDYLYRNEFRSDESDAKASGQGLWGRC